eukprot:scaffold26323_cov101-Isochrysis_galbana.AAC.2
MSRRELRTDTQDSNPWSAAPRLTSRAGHHRHIQPGNAADVHSRQPLPQKLNLQLLLAASAGRPARAVAPAVAPAGAPAAGGAAAAKAVEAVMQAVRRELPHVQRRRANHGVLLAECHLAVLAPEDEAVDAAAAAQAACGGRSDDGGQRSVVANAEGQEGGVGRRRCRGGRARGRVVDVPRHNRLQAQRHPGARHSLLHKGLGRLNRPANGVERRIHQLRHIEDLQRAPVGPLRLVGRHRHDQSQSRPGLPLGAHKAGRHAKDFCQEVPHRVERRLADARRRHLEPEIDTHPRRSDKHKGRAEGRAAWRGGCRGWREGRRTDRCERGGALIPVNEPRALTHPNRASARVRLRPAQPIAEGLRHPDEYIEWARARRRALQERQHATRSERVRPSLRNSRAGSRVGPGIENEILAPAEVDRDLLLVVGRGARGAGAVGGRRGLRVEGCGLSAPHANQEKLDCGGGLLAEGSIRGINGRHRARGLDRRLAQRTRGARFAQRARGVRRRRHAACGTEVLLQLDGVLLRRLAAAATCGGANAGYDRPFFEETGVVRRLLKNVPHEHRQVKRIDPAVTDPAVAITRGGRAKEAGIGDGGHVALSSQVGALQSTERGSGGDIETLEPRVGNDRRQPRGTGSAH